MLNLVVGANQPAVDHTKQKREELSINSYDLFPALIYDHAAWSRHLLLREKRTMKSKATILDSPKRKPRVQREIVAGLARRILSGEIRSLTYLPKESELCAEYNVSRTVIREATKVLESKGLLRSRSRVGTLVLGSSEWNMLDPDLLAWAGSKFHDPRFVQSLMEARCIIEPAAAELAAERAEPHDLARLDDAYQRMCASLPHDAPHDVDQCSQADLDFHTALLIATHNHVLIQLATVIRASLRALFELTTHLGSAHKRALHLHGEVVEAVRLRRPDKARPAILKILDAAVVDLDLTPLHVVPGRRRRFATGKGRARKPGASGGV